MARIVSVGMTLLVTRILSKAVHQTAVTKGILVSQSVDGCEICRLARGRAELCRLGFAPLVTFRIRERRCCLGSASSRSCETKC